MLASVMTIWDHLREISNVALIQLLTTSYFPLPVVFFFFPHNNHTCEISSLQALSVPAQVCHCGPDHVPKDLSQSAWDSFPLQGSKMNIKKAINWWVGSRRCLLLNRQAKETECRRARALMKQEDFKVVCRDTDVLCCHWTQTTWAVSHCSSS